MKKQTFSYKIKLAAAAAGIPLLLAVQGIQSWRYVSRENDLRQMEKKQQELIENNKQLISEISLLGSSERIEKIVVEKFGMRPADTDEIVRVEIKR